MSVIATAQINDAALHFAGSVQRELEKGLKTTFELWQQSETERLPGRCTPGLVSELALHTQLARQLSQLNFEQPSTVIHLGEGQQWLTVTVHQEGGQRLLLLGRIESIPAHFACALADSVLESQKRLRELEATRQQLDYCIFQITANFEELTWLRSLAEHFEICSLQNDLARAAQTTLPSLRLLIYAQELFLFAAAPADESGAATNDDCPLLSFDGEGAISEEVARSLLVQATSQGVRQSIVYNSPACGELNGCPSDIRNYILTPVTKCQELYGWLLAINKNMPLDDSVCAGLESEGMNMIEFGTTEAGLLSTMAVMLATHGKNVDQLKEKESMLVGMIRALVNTIDAKDAYTCGHSDRVAMMSKRIARQLNKSDSECDQAYMAGLLHDIGKIGVPDCVLGKPSQLSDEEFALMKTHPVIGVEILRHLKPFSFVLPGVLHHHEAFDGTGYPHGLAGEQIPLLGRIISVADSYDAMTSNRTYRVGMPAENAEAILRSGAGTQWDGHIIDAFFAVLKDIHSICGLGSAQVKEADGQPGVETPEFGRLVEACIANC